MENNERKDKMKGTELSFMEEYLYKIREGKETPFECKAGTGAWWFKNE